MVQNERREKKSSHGESRKLPWLTSPTNSLHPIAFSHPDTTHAWNLNKFTFEQMYHIRFVLSTHMVIFSKYGMFVQI